MMTRRLFRLFHGLALCLLALLPVHAWATTFTVTDNADSATDTGSIRYAANSAVSGDTVNITYSGVIPLGSTLPIQSGVTVNGPTTGSIQISGLGGQGVGGFSVVEVHSGSGTAAFNNLTLEDGISAAQGGELLVDSGASAALNGCTLTAGGAGSGGGVYNAGTLTLNNCTVSGNVAPSGNGGGIDNTGTLTLADCSLSVNAAGPNTSGSGSGGGLYNEAAGIATIDRTLISGNTASLKGAGIENANQLTLRTSVLTSNVAQNSGGGVDNTGNTASDEIISCSFAGNSGSVGNGIASVSGAAYLTDDIIENVVGTGTGSQGNIHASHCDFYGTAPTSGLNGSSTGNINSPPDFVRAPGTNGAGDTGDLHLQAASPCLHAGMAGDAPSSGAPYIIPPYDFDGFTRPLPPSIGAYDAPQATLTVNNTTDTGLASGSLGADTNLTPNATTLRGTVNYANDYSGVSIGFDSTVFAAAKTIAETQGTLTLSKAMSIAASAGGLVNVSGNGVNPVFTVGAAGVSLDDLGITGGGPVYSALFGPSGGGGVVINSGASAFLTGCTIYGNTIDGSGGGVSNVGTVSLTNCALSGNTAVGTVGINGGEGGGLYNGGAATVLNSFIGQSVTNGRVTGSGNTTVVGGGIYNDINATLTLTNSVIAGNNGTGGGGGLDNVATATVRVTNCTFVGNTAGSSSVQAPGGGIYNGSPPGPTGGNPTPAPLVLLNCTFTGNSATNGGGALASYGGAALVNDILYGDTGSPAEDVSAGNANGNPDTAYHCDIQDSLATDGLTAGDNGNVTGNPAFLTPYTSSTAVYDLRLGTGSAAKQTGTATSSVEAAPGTDITGAGRPSPPSIGAFDINATNGTGPAAVTGSGGGTTPTATTTTVASSANPSTAGQSVTFTATVAPASGTTTPTGTVTFTVDGTAEPAVTLSGSGTATYSTAGLSAGTHTVTAAYAGSTSFAASSTANTLTQTVNAATKTGTTTTLNSSANPSTVGQSVTLTATVAPSSGTGTPTGTVTFTVDGTAGSPVTLTNGSATLTTGTLAQGSHTVTAAYSGDSSFATSTSAAFTQTVNFNGTTTGVTSSANPSTVGQSVTFTATVAPASGTTTPTGTVTFTVDGTAEPAVTLSGSGTATFTTSALTQGSRSVTATYNGSSAYAVSTSSTLTQTVNAAGTTLIGTGGTLTSSAPNGSTFGQSVRFTTVVTANSGTGTPTGTVTYTVDGGTGVNIVLSGGVATYTISTLPVGNHTIAATYNGSATYAPFSSPLTMVQSVAAAATTTTLTASANPVTAGQSVTLTATISPGSGTGTPTGTVTFTLTPQTGSVVTSPAEPLTNGVATYTTSSLPAGTYTVTAAYAGDSSHAASTGRLTPSLTISAASTTPTVLHTFPAGLQMISFTENYAGVADPWSAPTSEPLDTSYNNATGQYLLTSTLPTPGQGAWVSLSVPTSVYDTGTPATGTVSVPLAAGWNLIGDPFAAPVAVSGLSASSGGTTYSGLAAANQRGLLYTTLYTYPAGSTAGYTTVTAAGSLQPFAGYWLYAFKPCTLLISAPVTPQQAPKTPKRH